MRKFLLTIIPIFIAIIMTGCGGNQFALSGNLPKLKEDIKKGYSKEELNNSLVDSIRGDNKEAKNYNTTKFLVDNGADVNANYKIFDLNAFPLYFSKNLKTIKLLVEHGADVNKVAFSSMFDKKYTLITNYAFFTSDKSIDYNEMNRIIKFLVKSGANLDYKNTYNKTALLIALRRSNTKMAKILIQNGANVNINYSNTNSPLIYSLAKKYHDISKLLIKKGANSTYKNNKGFIPLLHATHKGYYDLVKLMIDKGTDLNIKDKNGNTALLWASYSGYTDIAKLLIEKVMI